MIPIGLLTDCRPLAGMGSQLGNDLWKASWPLYNASVYEGNPEDFTAMKSLMVELQDEQNRLEKSTLEAGLASSMSVPGPFYSKVTPDITFASSPPPANLDLATASEKQVLAQTMSSREKVIESAYDQAVPTLSAVSTEHQKLEAKQGVDVSLILAEVQYLRDITKAIGE
jgi:hypothetical protein